jgi:hypothetical protein
MNSFSQEQISRAQLTDETKILILETVDTWKLGSS